MHSGVEQQTRRDIKMFTLEIFLQCISEHSQIFQILKISKLGKSKTEIHTLLKSSQQ